MSEQRDRVDRILEAVQVAMAGFAFGYLIGTMLTDWLHWL